MQSARRNTSVVDQVRPHLVVVVWLAELIDYCAVHFDRSERLAKYNQLLRIEEELGADAVYAGENWRFIGWESA